MTRSDSRSALVTGGAGFIGSNVASLLAERGWNVVVLDDLTTGYRRNLDRCPVEFVEGDVRDTALIQKLVRGVRVVFHLAASVGNVRSLSNPVADSDINVLGTVNLLETARRAGVERVVYSSSAAVFGELITIPIAEDHPQNPESPYGVSKLAAEKHALCFGRLYGMTVVCLRYFNVYGVHQRYDAYGNVIPIFADRLLDGKPLIVYGDGEQTRDFVNVKDVAQANYLAATAARSSGVYNIGCGTSVTVNALARLVQEASGVRAAAVEHAAPRQGEVRHCRADIARARAGLGFAPSTDIAAGLREYFDWFRRDRAV